MLVTADSRAVLRDALRLRLAGEWSADIDETLPCPAGLSQVEKSAWLMLQNWSCDEDLRDRCLTHAEYSHDRLRHLLQQLA